MRLVSFVLEGGTRLGALHRARGVEEVVDLNGADPAIPSDIAAFLEGGEAALERARAAVEHAGARARLPLAQVRLLSPVPRPGKIVCIGQNYLEHAAESHAGASAYPIIFAKYANTMIASGDAIVLPRISTQVDYEGELAVVIGRRAKNVDEQAALQYVGGYAPYNDVSARDFQSRTSQWTIGKTFDSFGPMGPALITADEVPDPQNLDLRLSIGDEVLQSSNTSKMIFPIARLIAYITAAMTLEPGDVIATGTPEGIGAARTPQRFLRPGDVVRVEIQGLGALVNPVKAEA
jgi:2-keto-4-pentenoate hydratase/2-oxohepta-3-ene-1,7-dioic acid hydratase in catechol pathway